MVMVAILPCPSGSLAGAVNCSLDAPRRSASCLPQRSMAVARHTFGSSSSPGSVFTCSPLLRTLLEAMVKPYLLKNPTAVAALDIIRAHDPGPICYDHFAFRTFGVYSLGISSIARAFLDMGYRPREELRFPAKKLRALWFCPPDHHVVSTGEGVNGPLPRIFISELLVDQLSPNAQAVIGKYTHHAEQISKHAATASAVNSLIWQTPSLSDYQILARESEYAAWTLVNGYALNHLTVSVHRLTSEIQKISLLNQLLENKGIQLNSEGGVLKGWIQFRSRASCNAACDVNVNQLVLDRLVAYDGSYHCYNS